VIEFQLPDATATTAIGKRLGAILPLGTLVLLTGDLGAGKTTLAQGIGQGLGVRDPIGSPTFTLLAEYPGQRGTLFHADLYRLESAEAVESTGLPDYIDRPDGLLLVEWPDRYPYWPEEAVRITLHHAGGSRRLTLEASPAIEALVAGGEA
jgi:tRNA threonylcarbamoyladenosine biosynthesis protein TsaE